MGGTSKSSFLDGIFHYKASILGYLHFRKPPNHCFQIENRLTAAFPHEALRRPVGGDLKQHGFCGRLMKKPYTIYGISLYSQASLTVKRGGGWLYFQSFRISISINFRRCSKLTSHASIYGIKGRSHPIGFTPEQGSIPWDQPAGLQQDGSPSRSTWTARRLNGMVIS